ncbi:MAG: DNA polymerase IV [Acidimicrobiales bacterium]
MPADRSVEVVPAILHVDMDAFFAAVEVLDRPELTGRPVIVGGTGRRGVVASCTYEARAFGVRSAMPTARARQLCPEAVFLDGRHSRYAEMSAALRGVLERATPLVEPIGLDEAFLDVTGSRRLLGSPRAIAERIRREVHQELSLECSVGIGRSKLIAKLASRAAKPVADRAGRRPGAGVRVVVPDEELAFLHPLPIEALWGVGPATARRLHDLGVRTVGELASVPVETMVRRFGRAHGLHLAGLARAQDDSPVVPDRPTKSVSHEETFRQDLFDAAELAGHLTGMAESVAAQLRRAGLVGRVVGVKVRYPDFTTVSRSHTLSFGADTGAALAAVGVALLGAVDLSPGVRLLGINASGLQPAGAGQQLAFELEVGAGGGPDGSGPGPAAGSADAGRLQESWREVTAAVDAIRDRFGRGSLAAASRLDRDGAGHRDDDARWGPSAGAGDR